MQKHPLIIIVNFSTDAELTKITKFSKHVELTNLISLAFFSGRENTVG